jgi:carbonic anhydrase/acetyltransferase-like protein (isoleucine patch superfamily)
MIRSYLDKKPSVHPSAYIIGDSVEIIGGVTVKSQVSLWPGCVLRADVADIVIGERTNIQDCAVVHVNYDMPTVIGDDVTVGHGAILHGCKIGNNCLIGMGSIILDGVIIEDNCVIGAGTLITEKKVIPKGSVVLGSPGKIVRQVTDQEVKLIKRSADEYVVFGQNHTKK